MWKKNFAKNSESEVCGSRTSLDLSSSHSCPLLLLGYVTFGKILCVELRKNAKSENNDADPHQFQKHGPTK